MDIKKAAKTLGISTNDLRYYERIGFIPEVKRTPKGDHDYSVGDLNWVYLVKSLRQFGISDELLIDFATLSKLAEKQDVTKAQVKLLAVVSHELEKQIAHLKDMQSLLTYKTVSEQLQNKHHEQVRPIWR